MATSTCESCDQPIDAAGPCPHCGHVTPAFAAELGRLERDIAEMSARDVALQKELKNLSAKMQAAQHQRALLAHAQQEQQRRSTPKQRTVRRRRAGVGSRDRAPSPPPPKAGPAAKAPPFRTVPPPPGGPEPAPKPNGTPPTAPGRARPGETRPRATPRSEPLNGSSGTPPAGASTTPPSPPPQSTTPSGHPAVRPETSSGSVQNILLVMGALLLAVAAVVFGAVAISVLDSASRAGILLLATAAMLLVPTLIARRGLTATAETVAAVGLLLVPLDGYALWTIDWLGFDALPGTFFAGLVCAVTVVVAAVYMTLSGLTVPRFAIVLAIQPVLPLLAYTWISGPAGWALVLAAVAMVDAGLGGVLGQALLPKLGTLNRAPEASASTPQTQLAVAAATFWLRELTWVMHGLALGTALVYAAFSLSVASSVPGVLRAAGALLTAAAVGLVGALTLRQRPLPDVAAGLVTLAVVGSAGRVVAVALPGRALVLIAGLVAVTALGVRALPDWARRGPQLASALALAVLGAVVAVNAVRAALATVRAVLPAWHADLAGYSRQLADAVGPAGWQLVVAALLLTLAAALALPLPVRREAAVAGVALAALAAPASLGLGWTVGPWLLVTVAVGLGAAGLGTRSRRTAAVHTAAAGLVGLAGAGAALAQPGLTAAVLTALTVAGVLTALAERLTPALPAGPLAPPGQPDGPAVPAGRSGAPAVRRPTAVLGEWAAGGALFALPGAVAAGVASAASTATPVLAMSFLAVCGSLGYAAVRQVSDRHLSIPLALGSGLGALVVAVAAFRTADSAADLWVGAFLLAGAILLFLAPTIDASRPADRMLDGPDTAAGVVTLATIAALARVGALAIPGSELATTAALVLVVALGVRAMPEDWRRGPILGGVVAGGLVAAVAGYSALRDGIRVLDTPGPLWAANLDAWPGASGSAAGWQAPVALLLLAAAAAVVLPRPARYDAAAAGVGLAAIGAPAALGLPWWSPIAVGGAVATAYGIASVVARDPRAGLARAVLAATVALHATVASLVRPWTTAAALSVITLVGAVVAILAVLMARLDHGTPDEAPDAGAHLALIGGAAVTGALLAAPGAAASIAAELGRPTEVVLTAALGASSLGLAIMALARRQAPQYLGYGTAGIAGGATITAIASLPTDQPAGVYAAAAALLGVISELLRAEAASSGVFRSVAAGGSGRSDASGPGSTRVAGAGRLVGNGRSAGGSPGRWRLGAVRSWSISPARGALAVSALPILLALAMIVPALVIALADPFQTLDAIWAGPPAVLRNPPDGDPANVLAALLLTIAAGLAAVGFSGNHASDEHRTGDEPGASDARSTGDEPGASDKRGTDGAGGPAQAIPVVLPGAAVTLLIAPAGLGAGWPAATLAALTVFTISTLGVALSPPPPDTEQTRPLQVTRQLVFVIGLLAGGAGLAGSLATRSMTLFTLGGAVAVGLTAALGGRTQLARILGWLFASAAAQGFVLTAGLVAGLPARSSAFGVLGVGAALLVAAATVPRLRRPAALPETAAVEWSGYAAALLALVLAASSVRHVAALLAAWGAVLGLSASRPNRNAVERRTLFWAAVGCEIGAWWLLMWLSDVALTEAYTLPFAALALLVGYLESRHRPDLSSWVAYGPALVAAFLPTLVTVLFTTSTATRQVILLLGAVATLIAGSVSRQRAPVLVGAVVTAIAALRLLTEYGPWLILVPVGLILLALGANYEKRRRDLQRLRGALNRMR